MSENQKTMSIPEAGRIYYGLSRNGSYDAAKRGEIPYIEVGRLRRVPVVQMDRKMEEPTLVEIEPPARQAVSRIGPPARTTMAGPFPDQTAKRGRPRKERRAATT